MRNPEDGTFAGAGTQWAFYEDQEMYRDNKVHVNLPYDFLTKEERRALSGPVKTYIDKELIKK